VNFTAGTGTARTIRASGTLTKVHPDAWAKSICVFPSGTALAGNQPWFQFSNQYDFTTLSVSATIYAPGGFDLSQQLRFEMFSWDSESFVPGLDARSTLTYTFDDAYPAGTAEYTGRLQSGDPTFQRPVQFPTNPPGYTAPQWSGYTPFYDVQPFHVSTAGQYSMVTANEYESAAVLYRDNFDPLNPLQNVMRAIMQTGNVLRNDTFNDLVFNDDASGGTVITMDLLPGVQYYFVTTAYAFPGQASDGGPFVGRYSNLIVPEGPNGGTVTLGVIPEPASLAGFIVIGFGLARRTRRA
jgi:hypothetical protein